MGGVALLAEARALRLIVTEWNGSLKVRGGAEHDDMVRRLFEEKGDVLAALRAESARLSGRRPTTCCRICSGQVYWRGPRGPWTCETCHPAPNRDVVEERETLCVPRDAWPEGEAVMERMDRHGWELVDASVSLPDFENADESGEAEGGRGDE